MPEPADVMIRVVRIKETGQVANMAPEQFRDPDVDKISAITNQIVANLQIDLKTEPGQRVPSQLAVSEVDLTFGVDFGIDPNAGVKVPIIVPASSGGIHGGSTFQVHIKFSRGD